MHNQMTFLLSAMHEDDSEGYRKAPARLAENPQPEQKTKPYKTNTAISHFRLNQKTGGVGWRGYYWNSHTNGVKKQKRR